MRARSDNWSFDFAVSALGCERAIRCARASTRCCCRHSYNTTVMDPGDRRNHLRQRLRRLRTGQPVCARRCTRRRRATTSQPRPSATTCSPTVPSRRTTSRPFTACCLPGDLFELPAGEVAAAIGYDYRDDEISTRSRTTSRGTACWRASSRTSAPSARSRRKSGSWKSRRRCWRIRRASRS